MSIISPIPTLKKFLTAWAEKITILSKNTTKIRQNLDLNQKINLKKIDLLFIN